MPRPIRPAFQHALILLALLSLGACSDRGKTGPTGPPGPPGTGGSDTQLGRRDILPGLNLVITELTGGTYGPTADHFRVGDTIRVTFTVEQDDGTALALSDLNWLRIIVSGPTTNFNPVIPQQTNVATAATRNSDGSWTYAFPVPIPGVYPAPINDTVSFGALDGELQGQSLQPGTYMIGLESYRDYTDIDGNVRRDTGNEVAHFLLGNSAVIDAREVVTQANCNLCHDSLRAHSSRRQDVAYCAACHTSGAEDNNKASLGGGTPGVTVDFKVLIHRLHNGAHLPSVNGVATNGDGSRNYGATPEANLYAGGSSVHDFSDILFPVWPSLSFTMPRDFGYSGLSTAAKAQEDEIRRGMVACDKCHGDPDGAGPLPAPAQGDLIYSNPAQKSCGSCHDDVDWASPYTANGSTMTAQASNEFCASCHADGTTWATRDAHVHPMLDPAVFPGLNFAVSDVAEAGTHDADGTIDPGEKIQLTFTIKDDSGTDVALSSLGSFSCVVAGPVENRNLLVSISPPRDYVTGPTYVMNVPMAVTYDYLGDATNNGAIEAFTSAYAPHWNTAASLTKVYERTATGAGSLLSAAGVAGNNFVDALVGATFTRNDVVVVDDGGAAEEYLLVAHLDGDRVYFTTPLRNAHLSAASLDIVTLTQLTSGVEYALTAATGTVTETGVASIAAGNAVVASYTTDFVMPAVYPPALNDSEDNGEDWGEWKNLAIADGTYTVGLWGYQSLSLVLFGETNSYRGTSEAGAADFLVGGATSFDSYDLISSADNCYACHSELMFHGGGRRGFTACVVCHGTAGGEDRPQYVAGNAPATTGQSIEFRNMLHMIHAGADLSAPEDFVVVGFGSGSYPNNFTPHTYEEVVFPAFPGGVMTCRKCHGASNTAWEEPADRSHPTAGTTGARAWRSACISCHDSPAAGAHADVQTNSAGIESCAVCHDASSEYDVDLMHRIYY